MKKIDECIGKSTVSKTLKFRAIPVGKTLENIQKKELIRNDEIRASQFKDVKKLMDQYHSHFIDRVLSNVCLTGLEKYEQLYLKLTRSDEDITKMKDLEKSFRNQIANTFTSDVKYNSLFKKEIIRKYLPSYLSDEDDKQKVKNFDDFSTAFRGYHINRQNMYSNDEKSTSIAYRCINENLPRFLSNKRCFEKISASLSADVFRQINTDFNSSLYEVQDCFTLEFFNHVLVQEGIDFYNYYIGGYTTESGEKVQGLNEYINLYNQQLKKDEKSKRLPKLKPLYKQILGLGESMSFYSEGFASDEEVYAAIQNVCQNIFAPKFSGIDNHKSTSIDALEMLENVFINITNYDLNGIYIKNCPSFNSLSKATTKDWSSFLQAWNKEYDDIYAKNPPKNFEKYDEKRRKVFKSNESFSLMKIEEWITLGEYEVTACNYYHQTVIDKTQKIREAYMNAKELLNHPEESEKPLCKDNNKIALIKNLLDAIKELEGLLKPLSGTGKEINRDEVFYGEFLAALDVLQSVDDIYDKVRNFVTKKPYSKEKFKLYFENPDFMNGWDRNKEPADMATLLRKDGKYYLVVIDKNNRNVFKTLPYVEGADYYEKMIYKQIPDAAQYLSLKQIRPQNPPKEVMDIMLKKKENSKSISKQEINMLIDYLSNDFLKHYSMIIDENGDNYFDFNLKRPEEYCNLNEFFQDVEKQAYSIKFEKISSEYIDKLVENGSIYLFQLYNKDFSPKSHGIPNLHTMYFLSLFSEKNLESSIIRLNGGAEMFYRKASIRQEDLIIHKSNEPIKTKNPLSKKKTVTFNYDITKDKRYAENQFFFHVPITINSHPDNRSRLNDTVRTMLKREDNPYVIGIDRGERNLIYICVVDGKGKIVEQMSLNEIVNINQGTEYRVDYHELLDMKENERKQARQNWTAIENIKELKEGYISQVIHIICQLVMKYDAIIAMEDLNSGFKNSRVKVEKQVYQKFEKMLIDKLNYMVDKEISLQNIDEHGGVLRGYQLTNPFDSFKNMKTQNGFIFYIPAWLTSKIDPTTGFADLLKPRYKNIEEAKKYIRSFESINYLPDENLFAFTFDYTNFERADADYQRKWTIYTNGERIRTFRNSDKNNEWDYEKVDLTQGMKELLCQYQIDSAYDNLIESICEINDAKFYEKFLNLLKLTLQMRNSITGRVDVDYLISPVKDANGVFYDSRKYKNMEHPFLPVDADANGAYNIARKALWAIEVFKNTDDDILSKAKIAISNKQWLEYAQINTHVNITE